MSPPQKENTKVGKQSQLSPNVSDTPNDPVEETPRPRRRLKRKADSSPIVLSDPDDSDEPVLSSPVKRRRLETVSELPETPRASADQDRLDIEEDVKDLQDSGTVPLHYRAYCSGSNLSLLKRSRRHEHEVGLLNPQGARDLSIWRSCAAGGRDKSQIAKMKMNPKQTMIKARTKTADANPILEYLIRLLVTWNRQSPVTKTLTVTKMTLFLKTTVCHSVFLRRRSPLNLLDTLTSSLRSTSGMWLAG